MKKLSSDLKKGIVKVQVENKDDLWYLSQLIDKTDKLKGKTYRKIKLNKAGEKSQVEKRPVTVTIEVEKVDFSESSLKINGKVAVQTEDIPKGSYQSITLEESSVVEIIKDKWLNYQKQRLKESFSAKVKGILIVVMDRESALFALTKKYGYDVLTTLQGDVQKKEERSVATGSFYLDIIKAVKEYVLRYKVDDVIIASPAFWKEDFMKVLKDNNLKKKIVLATCHSAEENAIKEVLKRDEIQTIIKEERIAKEEKLVGTLLEFISRDGKAVYGIKEVEAAANSGAIESLLITDKLISKSREEEDYDKIDNIMRLVDSLKGSINIISSDNEPGKEVDGLGGIAGILRYNIH